MPKIPPRDNRRNRSARTIQDTAHGMSGLLQRISRRSDVVVSTDEAPGAAVSHSDPLSHIDAIRAGLPDSLRPHVTACLLRPGEWVLFADAAVWATRLRLAACEVMAQGGFAALLSGSPPPRITVRVAAAGRTR